MILQNSVIMLLQKETPLRLLQSLQKKLNPQSMNSKNNLQCLKECISSRNKIAEKNTKWNNYKMMKVPLLTRFLSTTQNLRWFYRILAEFKLIIKQIQSPRKGLMGVSLNIRPRSSSCNKSLSKKIKLSSTLRKNQLSLKKVWKTQRFSWTWWFMTLEIRQIKWNSW